MSTGMSKHGSSPVASRFSTRTRQSPSPTTSAPGGNAPAFEACAATASFVLYAQRNLILVLHHDTLAIERRFELHREDVVWIAVDNTSERGSGRLAVSYDTGNTAIVWDILTGGEVARFSAYERIRIACFMRNGNIAFGNDQGNIILFEPATSEHISARTIFDPITALAPASDCRTFAIGYMNGSILIATLQPSFTILHTLTTSRTPARIDGLSWHGSSSKQKTDMLATQTCDGDLRVWSVPKGSSHEQPNIIRVLQRVESQQPGPSWFSWSKNGRIVQFAEGETRVWDVRTKRVSWETVPTGENVSGIASFGPTATLFTLGRGHFVTQFDVTPNGIPVQVASVQHVPANTPPTPPMNLEMGKHPFGDSRPSSAADRGFGETDESSADEGHPRSPLHRIAREMDSLDALDSELRDKVGPLSPTSSRASSQSSRSSQSRRRDRRYLYDKPGSSRASSTAGFTGTEFSIPTPVPRASQDNMSIRSMSSFASHTGSRFRQSSLRREILRSPEDIKAGAQVDLFPTTSIRLSEVPFRTPHYGDVARTPEVLQREMLSVVFGWNDTAPNLIREEMERHRPGSAGAVLLSKWLGSAPTDSLAYMLGSESMTSSDWMMLALSSISPDSQKKVGEAFVQRLLEKGDIHPAVAILIGLSETNDAIEVYVSQSFWLEAVLLTCIFYSSDWQRISYLLRKWGEDAVRQNQAELAVRLFSCTSIETNGPWFPHQALTLPTGPQSGPSQTKGGTSQSTSPQMSPPSRSASGRLTAKNAALKLITSFGDVNSAIPYAQDEKTPMQNNGGVTPIAQSAMPYSAMSPGGIQPWLRSTSRHARDPISARTMTPGAGGARKRLPSISDIERVKQETAQLTTPITAARDVAPGGSSNHSRRTSSVSNLQAPDTAIKDSASLPSPALGVFARLRENSQSRTSTKDGKPDGLAVQVMETKFVDNLSPSDSTSRHSHGRSRSGAYSPIMSDNNHPRGRVGAIDEYINSVEAARETARDGRTHSRKRGDSKSNRNGSSRARESSRTRGYTRETRYINPGKRSPSSPVPMSPEEIAEASKATRRASSIAGTEHNRNATMSPPSPQSTRSHRGGERRPSLRVRTSEDVSSGPLRMNERPNSPKNSRGRSQSRKATDDSRSPSAPVRMPSQLLQDREDATSDSQSSRQAHRRRAGDSSRERRAISRSRKDRSSTRRQSRDLPDLPAPSDVGTSSTMGTESNLSTFSGADNPALRPRHRALNRKELAARELEERRLSLARRPSAPQIPMPGDGQGRPPMTARAHTEQSPLANFPMFSRSTSAEPEQMSRYNKHTGTSATFGLPATPRAMRHPRHMGSELSEQEDAPPVPFLPDTVSQLSSVVSNRSNLSSNLSSTVNSNLTNLTSNLTSHISSDLSLSERRHLRERDDAIGPLLPPTVFNQKTAQLPTRAASAPPQDDNESGVHPAYKSGIPPSNRQQSMAQGHVRKISPPDASLPHSAYPGSLGPTSIDEALALHDHQVVLVPECAEPVGIVEREDPPILPELQHLADPPPPPPPPSFGLPPTHIGPPRIGSGVINIVIDGNASSTHGGTGNVPPSLSTTTYPHPMDRASTTSPQQHRRGRASVNDSQAPQTIGSRFRGIGERMRSTSRNRSNKEGPPVTTPYESVPPAMPSTTHKRNESFHRAKSPYEKAMAAQMGSTISSASESLPSQLPTTGSTVSSLSAASELDNGRVERTMPPSTRATSATGAALNTREVRANMPPKMVQPGAYTNAAEFL